MSQWRTIQQSYAGVTFVLVIPINDLREHEEEFTCWCNPTCDDQDEHVVTHHAADGREKFETGERKPS